MTDTLQQALHTAALAHPALSSLAVFAASKLLYVLIVLLVVLAFMHREIITWSLTARVVHSLAVAGLLTLLTNHLIQDPRPFVVEHYTPLAHATNDNGFPSDHTLIAALVAGWAFWFDRRWAALFVVGLLAVMFGRLAIGAHHTLDVLASVVYASLGLLAASFWRLPETWRTRPLLPFLANRPK